MHMMPPYSWSLRQVADDIGVGFATGHGGRKQLEMEGLIAHKDELTHTCTSAQMFSIRFETGELAFGGSAIIQLIGIDS
ncbi:hypothetical protein WKS02_000150 [Yersinia enterocolitica]